MLPHVGPRALCPQEVTQRAACPVWKTGRHVPIHVVSRPISYEPEPTERAAICFLDTDETGFCSHLISESLIPCHRLSLMSLPELRPHVWVILMKLWGFRLKPPSTAGQ